MASGPMHRFAEAMIRARWIVICVLIAVTAALGALIPRLQADFTPSDLFAAFGDSREIANEFRETFGNTDNVVLVLVEAPDVTTPENLGYLYQLTEAVTQIEGVRSAQSITSLPEPPKQLLERHSADTPVSDDELSFTDAIFDLYDVLSGVALLSEKEAPKEPGSSPELAENADAGPRLKPLITELPISEERAALVREVAKMSPMIDGRLLATDRSVAAVVAFLENDITQNKELAEVVHRFETSMATLQPPNAEISASLGGLPYVRTTVVRNMSADQTVLLPAAIGVSLLILLLAFRWLPALILPTIAVAMSAVALVGGMSLVREPLNILNNIIPTLVVLIGISSTIHILNRYRDNIAAGRMKSWAASDALATMVMACFLTSFTTAVGFGSLAVSKTDILKRFGLTAAAGVMIAYVMVILLVPTALTFFKEPKVRALSDSQGGFEDKLEGLTRWVLHRRVVILAVACISIGATLMLGLNTRVDSAVLDQVDPRDEVFRTTRLIEQKLGGIRPLEVFVRADEPWAVLQPEVIEALMDLTDYAREQEGVLNTLGYTDLLRETQVMISGDLSARDDALNDPDQMRGLANLMQTHPRNPLESWLRNEGQSARIQIMVEDMGALETNKLLDRMEAEAAARFENIPGVHVRFTGDAYIGSRGLDAVISDLIGSLATAVLIIFVLLALLFRSLRMGLVSIPPALMPLAFTLCWMWIRGIPLNTATAIIFSIAIGMTVDGCIHFMTRFREEYRESTTLDDAIVAAARGSGKAIIFTCVALIVGFGVMLISQFVPIRRFGELVAFTILVMMIATILVLPALLRVAYANQEKRRVAAAVAR